MLQITNIHLKNFRCFPSLTLDLAHPLVLINGNNGAGKTSLLEALHYACYLRSFRTPTPRDLIDFAAQNFFIKIAFSSDTSSHQKDHEVQVGFSGKKRLVKLDQKIICSYKDLLDSYRIITLTENDLGLISGGPEERRSFIDQALLLYDHGFLPHMRAYRQVLDNRTMLFARGARPSMSHYEVWTQQLYEYSVIIQHQRLEALRGLQDQVNQVLRDSFGESITINLEYQPKKGIRGETFEEFMRNNVDLYEQEVRYGRTLFGAHLDDFSIQFQGLRSKQYASRGQQKLILVLLKIAQLIQLRHCKGSAVFLLDDFMTDFDEQRSGVLLQALLGLGAQLIFTSPVRSGAFEEQLRGHGAHKVELTY